MNNTYHKRLENKSYNWQLEGSLFSEHIAQEISVKFVVANPIDKVQAYDLQEEKATEHNKETLHRLGCKIERE